ncbi:MAG: hypothetical protein ACREQV_22965 [Candidatus Binatia bacterium]
MHKIFLSALLVGMVGSDLKRVDAAYVIKLKNGHEYVTARYWQDGGQVLFDTYGGIFGVERAFVARIEKTDQSVRLASVIERDLADKAQADSATQNKEPVETKPAEETKTEKQREDDPVVSEFNRLKEKSKEVDGMLTSEIRDLLREIKAFKDKVSGDSKLFVNYGREFNDVHEISSAVEAALESRR